MFKWLGGELFGCSFFSSDVFLGWSDFSGSDCDTVATFQLPMTDPWCWYTNANMNGVYWWDPWHTIYSSTMDPMGYWISLDPWNANQKKHDQSQRPCKKNSLDMESSRKKIGFSILNFLNHPATAMTMEILMCSIWLLKIKLASISQQRKESTHLHMPGAELWCHEMTEMGMDQNIAMV